MLKKVSRLDSGPANGASESIPNLDTGEASTPVPDWYIFRVKVQQRLEAFTKNHDDIRKTPHLDRKIELCLEDLLTEGNISLTAEERQSVLQEAKADALGYGLLQPLLDDDSITEIMVNGPKEIYVERLGLLELLRAGFENEAHLARIIERMVSNVGRRIDGASPMVNARLPHGHRLNAVIAPLAVDGPALTIRKFARTPYTVQDLINNGTFTPQCIGFLKACVEARINIVISGATGSGKTTLLNVASSFIPRGERIVTIEDTAELQLKQAHVVRLEARPPDVDEKGEITIRQLLFNALRMRPDRIIVGEARGAEALDMLQAMNTGHDGSLTTVHSNTPRDTLRRIELMTLTAGLEISSRAIREMIAAAIELVVHVDRLRDGSRKIVQVTEIDGMEGDIVRMTDLFVLDPSSPAKGQGTGTLRATGLLPKFEQKFAKNHVALPKSLFTANPL